MLRDCLLQLTRSLIRDAIFSQIEPPRRVDCFTPLWKHMRKVSFPRTQRYISPLRHWTGSRQPYGCQLALLSNEKSKNGDRSTKPAHKFMAIIPLLAIDLKATSNDNPTNDF